MKVVITGSSNGIGRAATGIFLSHGHEVYGLDLVETDMTHDNYTHCICDVGQKHTLPNIEDVEILINNAGSQNEVDDIRTNLYGVINCTEMYGLQPNIKSILNLASVSAHNGAEFSHYVASKGGVLSYTVWTAKEIASYGSTCNSISFGGVYTNMNYNIMVNPNKMDKVLDMTPLKKWMSADEAGEWIYFLTIINKSCTGQDIIVDNGEFYNHKFIW